MTLSVEEIIQMREKAIRDLLKEKATILNELEAARLRITQIDEDLQRLGYSDSSTSKSNRIRNVNTDKNEYSENTLLNGKSPEAISLYHDITKQILDLDSEIKLSFAKKCAAFSKDRHFCEVVVWVSKLTIYLDIPLEKLADSNNLCEDCSKIGRWASGQTRFQLSTSQELDYALNLIKQSYHYITSN